MKRWHIWILIAIVAFLGAAYSFLCFFAAADLGYDKYPGGKSIIAAWSYALLALGTTSVVCIVVGVRSYRHSVKDSIHK